MPEETDVEDAEEGEHLADHTLFEGVCVAKECRLNGPGERGLATIAHFLGGLAGDALFGVSRRWTWINTG